MLMLRRSIKPQSAKKADDKIAKFRKTFNMNCSLSNIQRLESKHCISRGDGRL